MTYEPPRADEAEWSVLGACLLSTDAIADVGEVLDGRDFYLPKHEQIFNAVRAVAMSGVPVGGVTVAAELRRRGELDKVGGFAYLDTLASTVANPAAAAYHAEIIRDRARRRRAMLKAQRVMQASQTDTTTPEDLAEAYANLLAELAGNDDFEPAGSGLVAPTLSEFLAGDDDPYDWLVPGLIERGDRVIVTGPEGGGKSTLLRQLAVQLAAGIHPFGGDGFLPLRVMLLDLENSERQVRRKIRPLHQTAKNQDLPLFAVIHPRGLDVLQAVDAAMLAETISTVRPDVLIGGPAYKLAGGDPTEEGTARAVAAYLDRLRTQHGFSLVLEAHSPYANGSTKRPLRPYGASLWSRWPEFGIHLSAEGEISHWRGQRDEREWPALLQRGGEWPWTPVSRERDVLWARIKTVCAEMGEKPSQRDLADVLKVSQTTVNRTIREHKADWDSLTPEADS